MWTLLKGVTIQNIWIERNKRIFKDQRCFDHKLGHNKKGLLPMEGLLNGREQFGCPIGILLLRGLPCELLIKSGTPISHYTPGITEKLG